jgi:hypothetical protein
MIEEFKAAGKKELKYINFPLLLPAGVIRQIIDGQEQDRRLKCHGDDKRYSSGFSYIHNNTVHEFICFSPELVKDLSEIEDIKHENKTLKQAAVNKFIKENK